jgi:amylosucrase
VTASTRSSRDRAAHTWSALQPVLEVAAVERLGADGAAVFLARAELHLLDLVEPLVLVHGDAAEGLAARVLALALEATAARPADLRTLDHRREIDPGWFQRARVQGYVAYTDRFAGTLAGLPARLDHLAELGVTYLHLMPLLRPRDGENDGGYAVADFRDVDPRVGTVADLTEVARVLRGRGISLCTDLVLNHTAREHAWAQGWLAGDPAFADFYTAHPDRTAPDAWDAVTPSVFPVRAPGSFTWVPEALGGAGGWVWTTFWPYQWDLRWSNPEVLLAVLGEVLWLANLGVEVFRMDAVPFLWKRLGSGRGGQNEPEAHALLQALHAAVKVAAPAVVFKAEAIVAPDDLVPYLGAHSIDGQSVYRPECELAYHNQLMVLLWSSLATGDALLARAALARMEPIPPQASWVTYSRCHDDIGWAVSDVDAAAVGLDGPCHRRFLNDFFAGRFPGSFARGALFQEDRATGDARVCGTAAALCGVWSAETSDELDRAVRRLVLLSAVTHGWGGVPLLYMGDELALDNDTTYLDDPALADDDRWMHRPHMDWGAAAGRHDESTVGGRVFGWTRRIIEARGSVVALRAGAGSEVLELDDTRVLGWVRHHPRGGPFVGLVNWGSTTAGVELSALHGLGVTDVVLASDTLGVIEGRLQLPALGFAWLARE